MELTLPLALAGTVFLTSWWLTGRFRRYALALRLLDVPNVRSSHTVATPRGGGVAIALTTLIAFVAAASLGLMAWQLAWGLLAGGALVSTVGFLDDRGHVARRWRLLGHCVAAGAVLAGLGGPPPLVILGRFLDLGWIGLGLAGLYAIWLINLTNFMDGIDGIASVETVTVSLGGVLLYLLYGSQGNHWVAPLILAAAALGFLVWNWPPARIFMGDAGSGFLGLMLAAFSLQAAWLAPPLLWSWVILLGVFIVDATVTLVRRMLRGDRFYQAHRSHAYQHAAVRWAAHKPVTVAVGAINLCWLLPVALFVAKGWLDGLLGVLLAYSPLVTTAFWFGAGVDQPDPRAFHDTDGSCETPQEDKRR